MNKRQYSSLVSAILLICAIPIALAQPSSTANEKPALTNTVTISVTDVGWIDKNHMEQEAGRINKLTLAKIGTPIRRDLSDLDTLQKLLDNNLVAQADYKTQQAMGIVLGNIMQADFPTALEWKIYEDSLGRSRALCVKGTSECLFPITMLSRRMELGNKPDVKKIYANAILLMEKYLPQLPYGGGIYYQLPRR